MLYVPIYTFSIHHFWIPEQDNIIISVFSPIFNWNFVITDPSAIGWSQIRQSAGHWFCGRSPFSSVWMTRLLLSEGKLLGGVGILYNHIKHDGKSYINGHLLV